MTTNQALKIQHGQRVKWTGKQGEMHADFEGTVEREAPYQLRVIWDLKGEADSVFMLNDRISLAAISLISQSVDNTGAPLDR